MIAVAMDALRRLHNKWRRNGIAGVYCSLAVVIRDCFGTKYREMMWAARTRLSRYCGSRFARAYVSGNHSWMVLDLHDKGISRDLFIWRRREPVATELLKALLGPGMTVLDIGANIGYYALMQARVVGMRGRVYAFEPIPESYDLLVRNIAMNCCSWVQCYRIALSSHPGQVMRMNIMERSNLAHVSSLGIVDNPDWAFGERVKKKGVIEVQTTTIDSFLADNNVSHPIDLIRMDVEGYETEIVEGGYDTMRDPKNKSLKVFMELHARLYKNIQPNPIKVMLEKLVEMGFWPRYLLDARGVREGLGVRECIDLGGDKLPGSHIFLERTW